jgi:phosphatidylglycerophosphate synthase
MDRVHLGPADRVTLVRAILAWGAAALVVHGLAAGPRVGALVTVSSVVLVLDAVDGYVARHTGTASTFGARFDMEVDAFLIAVLSVHVAPEAGGWVLAIGAMRYAYAAAGRLLPWLRRPLPPRFSAKTVAAVQGIVLTVAASGLLPDWLTRVSLAVALLLLVDSFGRDVWWQWRLRHDPLGATPALADRPAIPAGAVTVVAATVLWVALEPPRLTDGLGPGDFARIPVEGLALVGLAVVLPARLRRIAALLLGLLAAALVALRALGLGFDLFLDRSYNETTDRSYLPKGFEVVRDTEGGLTAWLVLAGAVVLIVGLAALLPWAALRVTRAAAEHRRRTVQSVLALGTAWAVCAVYGGPAAQVAAAGSSGLVIDTVGQLRDDHRDRDVFQEDLEADAFADTPSDRLLTGLRGKDVLLVWFESYGRVALEGSSFSPGILEALQEGGERLAAAGYLTRSAFLTSPTFGGASWLAHATLQSGVWADSEQRYGQLLESDRLTLTRAFGNAGWRTVFSVPANTRDWPEGAAYYGFDRLYDSRSVGYAGPEFGYASMPDQYTLEHLRRTELATTDRRPVMAEIDLVSSHHPWAPLPELVPWREVGDGSGVIGMPERGAAAVDGNEDPGRARRLYGESIEYTWRTIVSFHTTYPDPDRVLIVAGDHQPHSFVSGEDPGHDVPVTIITQDPAVVSRIADWEWQARLHPGPDAPVWRMDTFRDRLLTAYSGGA